MLLRHFLAFTRIRIRSAGQRTSAFCMMVDCRKIVELHLAMSFQGNKTRTVYLKITQLLYALVSTYLNNVQEISYKFVYLFFFFFLASQECSLNIKKNWTKLQQNTNTRLSLGERFQI